MLRADQFWQYAKEAVLAVSCAQTDEDKEGLYDLARVWTQAALQERHLHLFDVVRFASRERTRHVY
jgi:hypothetical protein